MFSGYAATMNYVTTTRCEFLSISLHDFHDVFRKFTDGTGGCDIRDAFAELLYLEIIRKNRLRLVGLKTMLPDLEYHSEVRRNDCVTAPDRTASERTTPNRTAPDATAIDCHGD